MADFTRAFVAFMHFNTAGFEKTITRDGILPGKNPSYTEKGYTKNVATVAAYFAETAADTIVVPVTSLSTEIEEDFVALLTPAKAAVVAGLKNSIKVSMIMRSTEPGAPALLTYAVVLKSNGVKTTHYITIDTGNAGD